MTTGFHQKALDVCQEPWGTKLQQWPLLKKLPRFLHCVWDFEARNPLDKAQDQGQSDSRGIQPWKGAATMAPLVFQSA